MSPQRIAAVLLLAVGSCPLHAQGVTVAVEALTALPVTLAQGGQPSSQSLPAGPLPTSGSVAVNPGSIESASFSWTANVTPTEATCELRMRASMQSSTYAEVGMGELLVTFTGTALSSMPCIYDASAEWLSGSAPVLTMYDIGNDGTFDWNFGFGQGADDIATQPLQVRIRYYLLEDSLGQTDIRLRFRVRPAYDIHIFNIPTACGTNPPCFCGSAPQFTVGGLFDSSNADIYIDSSYSTWHILGLATHPTLLPPALTVASDPCILMPTPDVVIWTGGIFLAIPPAARPLTLYAQLLDTSSGGLRLSDTYQIVAF